jgi:hypothetical protein
VEEVSKIELRSDVEDVSEVEESSEVLSENETVVGVEVVSEVEVNELDESVDVRVGVVSVDELPVSASVEEDEDLDSAEEEEEPDELLTLVEFWKVVDPVEVEVVVGGLVVQTDVELVEVDVALVLLVLASEA